MAQRPPRSSVDSFRDRKWKEALARESSSISTLTSAPFIMVGVSGGASNERVLSSSADIEVTDNGGGSTVTLALSETGVTEGSYTNSDITVDSRGRITAISSGSGGPGGSGNSVTASLNFGASFTDKAQTVVTGQSWVTANSEIVPHVKTPTGVDPDEMRLLDFKVVVSDLVAGTGFTVTLYSEPEAQGTYDVMCVGV